VSYLPSFPTDFTPLMAFGLILLIGSLGGFITHLIPWLPSITGFMAVGFFFGPSGINILSQETLAQAGILTHRPWAYSLSAWVVTRYGHAST